MLSEEDQQIIEAYALSKRLTLGWGVMDVENGSSKADKKAYKVYSLWVNMMRKVEKSDESIQDSDLFYPYSICDDWRLFSRFRRWVDSQEDRRQPGDVLNCSLKCWGYSRVFSPENCMFISKSLDNLFRLAKSSVDGSRVEGLILLDSGLWRAVAPQRIPGIKTYLGSFKDFKEARLKLEEWKLQRFQYHVDRMPEGEVRSALIAVIDGRG